MPLFWGNMFQPWHLFPDILDTSHSHVLVGITWSPRPPRFENLPSHSQELIFKPMEAFQERLGMGKARWCFVFRLGFFVWWIKSSKTNTRDDFFKLHLYIYIFTGHYWAIYIYGKTQNGRILKIQVICWSKQNQRLFQRFLIWRFQQFEAPLGDLPKRPRCHVEHFDDQRIGRQSSTRQTFYLWIFYGCILVRASKTSGII